MSLTDWSIKETDLSIQQIQLIKLKKQIYSYKKVMEDDGGLVFKNSHSRNRNGKKRRKQAITKKEQTSLDMKCEDN